MLLYYFRDITLYPESDTTVGSEQDVAMVGAEQDDVAEQNPDHYYNMDHKKRGLALVFNHGKFDANTPRKGTEIDRDRLEKTLQILDFDVQIHDDKTISEIRSILEDGKWTNQVVLFNTTF